MIDSGGGCRQLLRPALSRPVRYLLGAALAQYAHLGRRAGSQLEAGSRAQLELEQAMQYSAAVECAVSAGEGSDAHAAAKTPAMIHIRLLVPAAHNNMDMGMTPADPALIPVAVGIPAKVMMGCKSVHAASYSSFGLR
eukprot:scaffold4116_cov338-Prasinococcus_capsulatus_cf.AAC.9